MQSTRTGETEKLVATMLATMIAWKPADRLSKHILFCMESRQSELSMVWGM
jgi:hypothetical protein